MSNAIHFEGTRDLRAHSTPGETVWRAWLKNLLEERQRASAPIKSVN
jgi:hypothetical protein